MEGTSICKALYFQALNIRVVVVMGERGTSSGIQMSAKSVPETEKKKQKKKMKNTLGYRKGGSGEISGQKPKTLRE